jgi:carbonic anhydrase/acetyltransferase-like protein (isoleucine patch superfamily)
MPLYELDGETPKLPEDGNFWVAPGAHVIGKVSLGSGVGIWFGVVARGDLAPIVIGDRSNIQDNSVLHTEESHPLIIGTDVTIGHSATMHGCTIGDNTLVGMGATILTGAKIGSNSIVGANALVTEHKEFPDGSLIVGAPAKAIRQLDAATIEKLKAHAANYVDNAHRFAKGLRKIAD